MWGDVGRYGEMWGDVAPPVVVDDGLGAQPEAEQIDRVDAVAGRSEGGHVPARGEKSGRYGLSRAGSARRPPSGYKTGQGTFLVRAGATVRVRARGEVEG